MEIKKYMSYDGLVIYDSLIKAKIEEDDANTLVEAKKRCCCY